MECQNCKLTQRQLTFLYRELDKKNLEIEKLKDAIRRMAQEEKDLVDLKDSALDSLINDLKMNISEEPKNEVNPLGKKLQWYEKDGKLYLKED